MTEFQGNPAIAITHKDFQLGWVPKDLVALIGSLKIIGCKVRRVGTDAAGDWNQLHVDLSYLSTGEVVPVDKASALPKADRIAAAAELAMLAEAGIVPEGIPKRRRRRS